MKAQQTVIDKISILDQQMADTEKAISDVKSKLSEKLKKLQTKRNGLILKKKELIAASLVNIDADRLSELLGSGESAETN